MTSESLFARARGALGASGATALCWRVPGRIEFLGKHTDYAGGPSLLCAIERGFAIAAVPRADTRVTIIDATTGDRAETELSPQLAVRRRHWANYPFTVCRRVARNFPGRLHGLELAFASDLPSASGLSSSSALIVGTFLALSQVNDLGARDEYRSAIHNDGELAGYLGAIENGGNFGPLAGDRGVGTQGGSEDHTAILCARVDALVHYSFAPIRFERALSLPNDAVFVVASSGVRAAKTGNARAQYNRASALAAEALETWRARTGSAAASLAEALESAGGIEQLRDALRDRTELLDRVEQFAVESRIVRAAGDALARGDLEALGTLVDESQRAAEQLLGNQLPETIALARSARELGAIAASAFGAGFGGSVYALVRLTEAEAFRNRWSEDYRRTFPMRARSARFFVTRAGERASRRE
ncbi:MAG TPA: galactokinase family protein [Gemmatimonadaceae bacterium]